MTDSQTSLTSILEEGKTRVTKKVIRLETNLKGARAQLKAINDLLNIGSTPSPPVSAKK